MIWLVVWNMHFMTFHIIGNNDPKWLVFFRGVGIPPTTLGFLGTLPIKSLGSTVNTGIQNVGFVRDIPFLVGGLEHEFYDFPFSWEVHNPNWRSHIFQRGRSTTNQLSSFTKQLLKPTGEWYVSQGWCLVSGKVELRARRIGWLFFCWCCKIPSSKLTVCYGIAWWFVVYIPMNSMVIIDFP